MAEQGAAQYGGFWIRFLAYMVDSVLLWIAIFGVMFVAAFLGPAGGIVAMLAPLLLPLLYFTLMQASARQATLGKGLLGLKVGREGERLSIPRSLGRELAKIVSAIPLAIGFLIAAFTGRKQALHDFIASTTVVREGPSHVVAALAIALVGFLGPIVLVMFLGVGMLAAVMGGVGMGMLGEMMSEQARQQPGKPAAKAPAAPAPQSAPGKPAAPASSAASAADVDKLLAPVTGVDKPGAVRAGPAVLEISTFFSGGDPKVWVRVYVPQAVSRATVVVSQVTDGSGQNHYNAKSTFETEFFQNASLSDSSGRKEGIRSVSLNKGTTEPQVQKMDGVLKLQVPVGARTLSLQAGDAGKEQGVGAMKLKLNSIKGDSAEIELQGPRANLLQLRGLNAKGEAVPTEMTSSSGGAPLRMTAKFKGPVDRVELQVAAEIVERSFPFTLTRAATSAAAPAPVAAKPVPAPVAAKPAPVAEPPKPVVVAPVTVAPVAEAPKPKPVPRKRPAAPKSEVAPVAVAPTPVRVAPPVRPVLPAPKYSDLMSAVLARDPAGVRELLEFGKWADKPDRHGSTPLMVAVGLGDAASAEALLKAGANADRAVVVAQERRDQAMLGLLGRYGATSRRP